MGGASFEVVVPHVEYGRDSSKKWAPNALQGENVRLTTSQLVAEWQGSRYRAPDSPNAAQRQMLVVVRAGSLFA